MKKISLTLILLLLSACSFYSPKSQFYMMKSDGLSAVSDKALTVTVTRVKVPDILDKAQMVVYDKNSSEVQILEFHRWAEVLPEVLQTTITNDLMVYMPQAYVERAYFAGNTAQYSVNVKINAITAYKGDRVVLSAWWNIKNKDGKIIVRQQKDYVAKPTDNSIGALVDAQAEAVHQMSREIAATLLEQK